MPTPLKTIETDLETMSALPSDPTPPPMIRLTETQTSNRRLADSDYQQLLQSAILARPIRKTERVALFNGWCTLLAGCITVPFGIHDPFTLVFAIMLGAVGTRELTLRRRLHRFESGTTGKLALNQLTLGLLLSTYAIIKGIQSITGEGLITPEIANDPTIQSAQGVSEMLPMIDSMLRAATLLISILLIGVAVLVQGSTALYYLIRGSALTRFNARTPDWVVRVHHAVEGHTPKITETADR